MAEPDHLHDDGARLGRRRSWVVLALVLVVVVGLAVLRLDGSTADTSPEPRPTPPGVVPPTPRAWPVDLPAGTLFAVAGTSVYRIDTRDGALAGTAVDTDPARTSMTRLADGVLVWDRHRTRQVLTADLGPSPLRGGLRPATSFLPGPDGQVWGTTGRRPSRTTWRLVDADGRTTRSVTVDGAAASDGAGGLLSVGERSFRPVFPQPDRASRTGQVIATGPDGYVVRSCAQSGCRFLLHRRADGTDTALETAVGEDTSGGTLSPANRLLAVTETVGGTSTVRVSVVDSGQVEDIFPTRKRTLDAVWLDDRWLALVSSGRLVLYDAADERVVTPGLPLRSVGRLVWRPA